MKGTLTIIPTPIGNLEDITLRSINALKSVDVILCEDTRHSVKLLKHLEISKPLQAYHMHNEHAQVERLIEEMQNGKNYGLVSDAGTPGISDPGFLLSRACVENDIEVLTLPGPTALIPALVSSGLPCNNFYFEGFLPHKKGRQTRLKFLATLDCTIALYESPHRIVKTVKQIGEFINPEQYIVIGREISKLHEEFLRGTVSEIVSHFEKKAPKGEMVLMFNLSSK
jgi:16S rRNA (cytidine1402-2'-O)-methyltransferase